MKKYVYITVIILLAISSNVRAQYDYGFDFSKVGSAGLQFLKIGMGARETGMGEAVSGVVKDVNAVFWNPAGLAHVENYQATFSGNQWLADSKVFSAAAAIPFEAFVVAVSASAMTIKDFEETTVLLPEGTGRMVSAGDFMVGLSIARRFTDKLSIGGQIKYVYEKLDDYSIGNILFDVGAQYWTGWRNLRLAFSLQHFGSDMKLVDQSYRTPLLFRISATDELIITDQFVLTAACELVHPTDNNEWVNVGTEMWILDMLSLRGGYKFNVDEGKISFGAGIKVPYVTGSDIRLDYSFVKSEKVFDDINRFSIGFSF